MGDADTKGLLLYSNLQPVGYGLLRPFGRGLVVGPVAARTDHEASMLVSELLRSCEGKFVRIDVQDDNLPISLFGGTGLAEVDQVQIMAKGPLPETSGEFKKCALIGHAFG